MFLKEIVGGKYKILIEPTGNGKGIRLDAYERCQYSDGTSYYWRGSGLEKEYIVYPPSAFGRLLGMNLMSQVLDTADFIEDLLITKDRNKQRRDFMRKYRKQQMEDEVNNIVAASEPNDEEKEKI